MASTHQILKNDASLQQDVLDELDWDPEVDVTDVGVEVDSGVVTLTGTVPTFAIKMAAERAAFRVAGVRAVANDIIVHLPWSDDRTDTEIARAAANVIQHNTTIPQDTVDIRVANHWVTLSGTVEWEYQRRAAEKAVRRIHGVAGVVNNISLRQPTVDAGDVRDGIERALVRSAHVDAAGISVDVSGGHVTLTGTVRSLAEKFEAQQAAWRTKGVTTVTNHLRVLPPQTL